MNVLILRPLRWLGCFCLVSLEFLASLHLHGAVDNPVGSQRLQPLHFHNHHLGSTVITEISCRPGVIHLFRGHRAKKSRTDVLLANPFKLYIYIYITATATICSCRWCTNITCVHTEQPIKNTAILPVLKYRHNLQCHILNIVLNCGVTVKHSQV